MVRDLVTYPDKRIHITSPDLREFDERLFAVIEDLKDTIVANNTDALAAIQIAIPMSVIVIREDNGDFTEIINPRIIGKKGSIISDEKTLYFPNTIKDVQRYKEIKLIYQDRDGKQRSLDAKGKRAILLQRKIDYVFGDTIANRLQSSSRKVLQKELKNSGNIGSLESCSTSISKRDYFISFMQKIIFFIVVADISSFFILSETKETIFVFIQYGFIAILLLLIGYFFVAQKESKAQRSCSSCQMGNIVGTTVKYALFTLALYLISLYLFKV